MDNNRSALWKAEREREFLAAYDAYADALLRHCLLRIRDREQAKDIVQESFSRTWIYLSDGKEIEHMRAFLFRVAGNLIVDIARRRKTVSLDKMVEEDGFELADHESAAPERIPQMREAMQHLQALEEIYRTAITMRYFHHMSPGEIAAKLGVSENVVSVRIHRGIERLGRMMQRRPLLRGS